MVEERPVCPTQPFARHSVDGAIRLTAHVRTHLFARKAGGFAGGGRKAKKGPPHESMVMVIDHRVSE
jgi:hypothetical protein